MTLQTDTGCVRPHERFSFWREVVCRHFTTAESRSLGDRPFDAQISTASIGRFELGTLEAPPHVWTRDARHIRQDQCEDIMMSIVLDGSYRLGQNGREVVQNPGDIVIYDAARPFTYEMTATAIVFKVERNALASHASNMEALCGRKIGDGLAIKELLSSSVRHCAKNLPALADDPAAAPYVGASLVNLLLAVLEIETQGLPRCMSAAQINQLERLKRYILANLGDAGLSCERMASRAGVSLSSLNRLFAADGTTPMRWVWQQRLKGAREDLMKGRADSVTDVSLKFGFSELSHFSRSFKAAFGTTPQSVRRSDAGLN